MSALRSLHTLPPLGLQENKSKRPQEGTRVRVVLLLAPLFLRISQQHGDSENNKEKKNKERRRHRRHRRHRPHTNTNAEEAKRIDNHITMRMRPPRKMRWWGRHHRLRASCPLRLGRRLLMWRVSLNCALSVAGWS